MKTVTIGKLTKVIEGKLIAGNPVTHVSYINYGNYRYLSSNQIYFYTKQAEWTKQLDAIRTLKPLGVVLPDFLSHLTVPSSNIISVNDTNIAYWKIAKWNWTQYPTKVIGITGSAGKSTTTEMVASILQSKWPMVRTQGNLNTLTFLPDYLSRLTSKHKLLLLEMGMKSLKNIYTQCLIVKPQIGVITNVGEAHAGTLGNLDIVVKAKQEMVDGIAPDGILYINTDDQRSQLLNLKKCKGKIKTFGIKNIADIQGRDVKYTAYGMSFELEIEKKKIPIFIPTFGTHNVYNALAAIGIAWTMGTTMKEIQKGLATFVVPQMRLQMIKSSSGRTLINDAWNANPSAMVAGLNVLKNIAFNRPIYAVLGDMLELGDLTYSSHNYIGEYAAQIKMDQLITIGELGKIIADAAIQSGMSKQKVFSFANDNQLFRHLSKTPTNSLIYFKASRKLRLEKVIKRLT